MWCKARQESYKCLTTFPEQDGFSELRWVVRFGKLDQMTGACICEHASDWGIRVPAKHRWYGLLEVVKNSALTPPNPIDVPPAVFSLATKLGKAAPNPKIKGPCQLSWASKILSFAWPEREVYVWDSRSNKAIERLNNNYKANGSLSLDKYQSFCKYASDIFNETQKKDEFKAQLNTLIQSVDYFYQDKAIVPKLAKKWQDNWSEFLARRMFDKYLWIVGDKNLPIEF
jgi:hypothetical protein